LARATSPSSMNPGQAATTTKRLETALATWEVQAHRTLAASMVRVARVQAPSQSRTDQPCRRRRCHDQPGCRRERSTRPQRCHPINQVRSTSASRAFGPVASELDVSHHIDGRWIVPFDAGLPVYSLGSVQGSGASCCPCQSSRSPLADASALVAGMDQRVPEVLSCRPARRWPSKSSHVFAPSCNELRAPKSGGCVMFGRCESCLDHRSQPIRGPMMSVTQPSQPRLKTSSFSRPRRRPSSWEFRYARSVTGSPRAEFLTSILEGSSGSSRPT
jgi:hypothetical protein